jgi:hypothetical protein
MMKKDHSKIVVFFVVTPYSRVGAYQRFGANYCLHLYVEVAHLKGTNISVHFRAFYNDINFVTPHNCTRAIYFLSISLCFFPYFDFWVDKHFLGIYRFTYNSLSQRPPLWSSGQSSWLQIRRPGFDSRHYTRKKK